MDSLLGILWANRGCEFLAQAVLGALRRLGRRLDAAGPAAGPAAEGGAADGETPRVVLEAEPGGLRGPGGVGGGKLERWRTLDADVGTLLQHLDYACDAQR